MPAIIYAVPLKSKKNISIGYRKIEAIQKMANNTRINLIFIEY